MVAKSDWYNNEPSDTIWWRDDTDTMGYWEFSFDRKTVFNMFRDYPDKLTPEQVAIFDRENPYWAEFFADRREPT